MTNDVLVAGASGGVGRHVLGYLDGTDYRAVAATRSADRRSDLLAAGADEVRVGDLLTGDAPDLVADCRHVVSAVGSSPSLSALTGGLVDGEGVANLAAAASETGAERMVLTSSIGVGDSKEGMAMPLRAVLYPVLRAKERGEAALREAAVTSVIVRPGGLTDASATNDVVVGEGGVTVGGSVPRADAARLLVAALDTPAAADRTFGVVSHDGLNGDPTGVVDIDWQWPSESEEPSERY